MFACAEVMNKQTVFKEIKITSLLDLNDFS